MRLITVPVEKVTPEATLPKYMKYGDAGADVTAVEDVLIYPGTSRLIGTGLKMAIPYGYEIQMRPRSGISSKTRLRMPNSPGTIDSGYRGEILVLLENTHVVNNEPEDACTFAIMLDGKTKYNLQHLVPRGTYIVKAGERVAQLVLKESPTAVFEVVDSVDELGTNRGGGLGHTGVTVEYTGVVVTDNLEGDK